MANMSYYTADNVLAAALRGTAFPLPANLYLALFTTPISSPAGTGGTECTGGGYSRLALTLTNFAAPANGSTSNGAAINFPAATTPGWGTVQGWGVYDAATGGNLLLYGDMVGTNDVWTLTLGVQTTGTFSLTVGGNGPADTSWTLPFNPTAVEIQAYLETITGVGAGNVAVTGTGPFTVTFQGTLQWQAATMTGTFTGLTTPANASLTHTTTGSTGNIVVGTSANVNINAGSFTVTDL